MNKRYVALLGQRDSPTDAVEEYCNYLAPALLEHQIKLEITRVAWAEKGWKEALAELRANAKNAPGSWFLLQYTALAWSRRGFSWRVWRVLRLLRRSGARVATVFHDVEPYSGERFIDRLRRNIQLRTMRTALKLSDLSIFTVALHRNSWIGNANRRAVFIPVGANLPEPERAWAKGGTGPGDPPAVGMFSVSGGPPAEHEANLLEHIFGEVTHKLGRVRLVVMGRNSATAEPILREKLRDIQVDLTVHGLLSGEEVVTALGACDALLFLRGAISSRRGSAIAGIACGLPVIAREGSETAPPITEAGVVLLPSTAAQEFGPALARVLQDHGYRAQLAEQSRRAQTQYFCWKAIAAQFAEALRNAED